MKSKFGFLVLCLLMLVLTGCGNGGGGNNGHDSINTPVPTTPIPIYSPTPSQSPNNSPSPTPNHSSSPSPTATPIQSPTPNPSFHAPSGREITQAVSNEITIHISSNTFPQGSEIEFTANTTADKPSTPDFEFIGSQPLIDITSSNIPQGTITLTISDKTKAKNTNYLYVLLSKTANGWDAINDLGTQVVNSTNIIIDKTKWINNRLKVVIGRIRITSIAEETGLSQVGNDDTLAPADKVIILVHGLNTTAESMRLTANTIREAHLYRKIYLFSYDWRDRASSAAVGLGRYLDIFYSHNYHVDFLAHSRGVLICRYALEDIGKTEAVANLYAVCGPNKGANFSSAIDLLRTLRIDYINLTGNDFPFGLADIGSPAVEELLPNSEFLRWLNCPKNRQRYYVNYYLFSGFYDILVSTESALAEDIPLNMILAGTIEEFPRYHTHTNFINSRDGIDDILNVMRRQKNNNIELSADSKYIDIENDGYSWCYTLTITNKSNNSVTIQDMSIDEYDRYGNWTSLCWYDPYNIPEEMFPTEYLIWNKYFTPGETIDIGIKTRVDGQDHNIYNTLEKNKAKTMIFSLKYQDGNIEKEALYAFILRFGDISPERAHVKNKSPINYVNSNKNTNTTSLK